MNISTLLIKFINHKCDININVDTPAKELWLRFMEYLQHKNLHANLTLNGFSSLMATFITNTNCSIGKHAILKVKKKGKNYYVGIRCRTSDLPEPKLPIQLNLKTPRSAEKPAFGSHYMLEIRKHPIPYQVSILTFADLPVLNELSPDSALRQAQQYCDTYFEVLQELRSSNVPDIKLDKKLIDARTRDVLKLESDIKTLSEDIRRSMMSPSKQAFLQPVLQGDQHNDTIG